jgi:protein-S-isoprenylcysteine O-methyltransferase Ste14
MRRILQHILGYIIGGTISLFLVPYGIFSVAKSLDHLISFQLIPIFYLRIVLLIILLVVGLSFGFWSIIIQNIVGKGGPLEVANIEVSPKTQKLVVTGPYRYTRNPMLFGACMIYFAVATYLNSIIAFGIVILFTVFMLIFVKLTEEKRLLREFGKEYEEYHRKVSMFFPWLAGK